MKNPHTCVSKVGYSCILASFVVSFSRRFLFFLYFACIIEIVYSFKFEYCCMFLFVSFFLFFNITFISVLDPKIRYFQPEDDSECRGMCVFPSFLLINKLVFIGIFDWFMIFFFCSLSDESHFDGKKTHKLL